MGFIVMHIGWKLYKIYQVDSLEDSRPNLTQVAHHCSKLSNIVECLYNAVQYSMILQVLLQWRVGNINQNSNTQKALYQVSYGVSFVRILEKINRIITALHCIVFFTVHKPKKGLCIITNKIGNVASLFHIYPCSM